MPEQKIYQVLHVELRTLLSTPPMLHIEARGEVGSSGFRNPKLVVRGSKDGVYEFDFMAEPPSGPSSPVITPISASLVLPEIPGDLRAVCVNAETNHMEAKYEGNWRLCEAKDIEYRAFRRSYDGGGGQVVLALASCSHPQTGWTLSLRERGEGDFVLLEREGSGLMPVVTYDSTCFSSASGREPLKMICIEDASGKHDVVLEPMG